MSHSQSAYYANLSANNTRPDSFTIAPADEQALIDLAAGRAVGADIHRRYIDRAEEHPILDRYSCHCEGHAERMRYHEQRVKAHR